MNIQCFMIEPTDQMKRWLRIYSTAVGVACPVNGTYHQGMVEIDTVAYDPDASEDWDPLDARWPTHCDCGAELKGHRHVFTQLLWRRLDTGEILTLRDMPDGAMYHANWFAKYKHFTGLDGLSLHVRVPERHDWNIDGRASNCDSPCATCAAPYNAHQGRDHHYVDSRPDHKCWIRHGTPPNITVDKAGNTCGAGGGSILTKQWHGFLRNGVLEQC